MQYGILNQMFTIPVITLRFQTISEFRKVAPFNLMVPLSDSVVVVNNRTESSESDIVNFGHAIDHELQMDKLHQIHNQQTSSSSPEKKQPFFCCLTLIVQLLAIAACIIRR